MKATNWIFKAMLAVMAAVVLGSVLIGPVAAAETSGSGTVTAQGVGTARVEGDGSVVIEPGAGTVWVAGTADITTEGRGRRTLLADGTVRLTGYSGRITISGDDLVVRIAGGALGFTATGTGSVVLAGKGSYTTGNVSGTWAKHGVTIGY